MKRTQYYKQVIDLFQKDSLTRQDIANALNISMPTTLQVVNGLLEEGILMEVGTLESTGGRKAKCLTINKDMAYVVGVNVGLHHVSIVVLNYGGDVVDDYRYSTVFKDEIAWYDELKENIEALVKKNEISMEDVLCVGVSFPGIIDDDMGWILHSHVFNLHNISLDRFRKMFSVPVAVFNDANSGGYTELNSYGNSYVYLSLNESVGGAIILDGNLYAGDTFHAGEIGHMLLVPGGKRCYCGKKGCADAYLSAGLLMDEDRDIQKFEIALQQNQEEALEKWDTYLYWLAIFVTNIRMVFNNQLIIGGEVGKIIDPYLPELKKRMVENDLFARDMDYVFGCKIKKNAMAIGAGNLALQKYRNRLLEKITLD